MIYTNILSMNKLDLAFNNVKPKDWYFVLDKVQFRTDLGCVRLKNQIFWLDGSRASFLVLVLLSTWSIFWLNESTGSF